MSHFYLIFRVLIQLVFLIASVDLVSAETLQVVRMNDGKPIITRQMFEQVGAPVADGMNINGPSLIKVPEWLKKSGKVVHPEANYYLYFAHHKGKYIRLAWAKNIEGPWHLHAVNKAEGKRGVLDLGKSSRIDLLSGLSLHKHIASPDVFVDDNSRMIVMYFHAPTLVQGKPDVEQKSFMATSQDGMDFNYISKSPKTYGIRPVKLGKSYFRVFKWRNQTYAISSLGLLYKEPKLASYENIVQSSNGQDLWQLRSEPLLSTIKGIEGINLEPRHSAVFIRDDKLWVFYTRRGDSPERILLSRIDISDDWLKWKEKYPPHEVLAPQKRWEGLGYSLRPSKSGASTKEQALRDPYVFEEAGKYYLLYCGAGEEAIGIARLYLQ
jgi:hypothetical protein